MGSYQLPPSWREYFRRKPETGMGFQELANIPPQLGVAAFVVNSSHLWTIDQMSELNPNPQQPHLHIQPLFRDWETFIARTEERERELRDSDLQMMTVVAGVPSLPPTTPTPGTPGLPPYLHFSRSGDEFYRLSASRSDWRISSDGSLAPMTYATTPNDLFVVPSGLAAVGRYALPTRLPACYVYQIIPDPGTPLFFGTVIPNYGMCGGGVEVLFPYGCGPGSARLTKTIPMA